MLATNKTTNKIDLYIPSDEAIIHSNITALEEFVMWAESFLKNHYVAGSNVKDAEKIREEVEKLRLDIQCVDDFVNTEF